MKVEMILDFTYPDRKTIKDFPEDKILCFDPTKVTFEEFTKDHKPGEYIYNVLGMYHYKCFNHPTFPMRLEMFNPGIDIGKL